MCGIVGTTGFGSVPYEETFVDRGCAAIQHRGPDEQGKHHDRAVSLGVQRLSVIGLTGGSQPVYSEDGLIVCVVNGEIYNHRAMRELLAGRGRPVHGTSDVAVVPELYKEFGEQFVEQLDGMFAIALFDGRSRQLLLATDRTGKKPLFWTRLNDASVAFASELGALASHPRFVRDTDPHAIDQYLSYRIVPAPRTVYSHAQKMPPGTVMVFDANSRERVWRYWQFPFTAELTDISEREAVDRLDELLRDAVAKRLESEVPLGAMLSGGLDSSLVVAMARRLLGRPMHTFSIGFEHGTFDESAQAQTVAEYCGTQHHTRLITAEDARRSADRILHHVGEPFAFPSAVASDAMYEIARQRVTVVLTGDGADEVFCGYRRYQRFLDQSSGDLPDRYESVLLDGVPTALKAVLYSKEFRAQLPNFPVNYLRDRFHHTDRATPDLDRAMHVDSGFWLSDAQLVKIDRMAMAHSVEPRSPMLDHRLIDFAARLPASRKLVDGAEKVPLKKVAERYLPSSIVYRRKQELAVPLEAWLGRELQDSIQRLLLTDTALDRGYFAPDALRKIVTEFRPEHSYTLWTLYMLERWHQIHVDRTVAASAF